MKELEIIVETVELEVLPRCWVRDRNEVLIDMCKRSQKEKYDHHSSSSYHPHTNGSFYPTAIQSRSWTPILCLKYMGGNQNGLLLSAPNSDDGCKQVAKWICKR